MRTFNFNHLRYFWLVAQTGSVTLASRRLHVSQPSVSAQLKLFERDLGEKLFERRGRGLALTDSGKVVYEYANQIFSLGDDLLQAVTRRDDERTGTLNVGIADVIPKSLVYQLIKPGLEHRSGWALTCTEDRTERLLADLSIAELDLVIADRPIPPNVKVRAFNHFIGECPVVFMGTESIRMRIGKKFPESLSSAPLLLPTAESSVRSELDRWFHEIGIRPKPIAEIQDRALMKIAARDGLGILPVPQVIEAEVRKEFGLRRIGIAETVHEKIFLITVERRIKNPLVLRIADRAREKLFHLPPESSLTKRS